MNPNRLFKLCMLLLGSLLLHSCSLVEEDVSECRDLVIKYVYHLEVDGVTDDDFIEDIDYIKVYIFDANRKFVTLLEIKSQLLEGRGHIITVPASYEGNTMVTWGHEHADSYSLPTMMVGDDISKLTLKLNTDVDQWGYPTNINTKKIANLFYGGEELMLFSEDNKAQIVYFKRMSKILNVKLIDGNSDVNIEAYDVSLTAQNGHYLSNNDIVPQSEIIIYKPVNYVAISRNGTSKSEGNIAELHTLRLIYNSDATLKIINNQTGQPITFAGADELDLIEHILRLKPDGMAPQEFLDQKSDWPITFDLDTDKNIAISIRIHDWILWFDGGSIGR